jgi:hypothetical protein
MDNQYRLRETAGPRVPRSGKHPSRDNLNLIGLNFAAACALGGCQNRSEVDVIPAKSLPAKSLPATSLIDKREWGERGTRAVDGPSTAFSSEVDNRFASGKRIKSRI